MFVLVLSVLLFLIIFYCSNICRGICFSLVAPSSLSILIKHNQIHYELNLMGCLAKKSGATKLKELSVVLYVFNGYLWVP